MPKRCRQRVSASESSNGRQSRAAIPAWGNAPLSALRRNPVVVDCGHPSRRQEHFCLAAGEPLGSACRGRLCGSILQFGSSLHIPPTESQSVTYHSAGGSDEPHCERTFYIIGHRPAKGQVPRRMGLSTPDLARIAKIGNDLVGKDVGGLLAGVEHQFGLQGGLVGIVDPRKAFQLAGPGFLVQPLRVAGFADCEGASTKISTKSPAVRVARTWSRSTR